MILKKHYEIPFLKECAVLLICYISLIERDNHQQESTVCSPLHKLAIRTPQGYIAKQVTTHSGTSDDCITSITYAISYLFNNKSRSISNTLGKINRIPFLCKAKTLRAFFCNSLSNRPSTLTGFL